MLAQLLPPPHNTSRPLLDGLLHNSGRRIRCRIRALRWGHHLSAQAYRTVFNLFGRTGRPRVKCPPVVLWKSCIQNWLEPVRAWRVRMKPNFAQQRNNGLLL
eukprot:6732990-Pyramimonas_sp.AAC.2